MIVSRALHLTVLALVSLAKPEPERDAFFRSAENSSEGIAGNITPIVHTALAFDPTAQQAAPKETA